LKEASLIIIGDEILAGNTVDTNSNFIARQLEEIGIKVKQIFTIPDEVSTISSYLKLASETSDLIITTGGLGPTKDDKTKKAFADFFKDKLIFSEDLYERLKQYLKERNRLEILELNRNQCEVLSKAEIIPNSYGTAPCQMIQQNGKLFFSLPGVPYEMKHLIEENIVPFLYRKWGLSFIYNRTISVVGLPESLLASKIEKWENELPEDVHLSYLPTGSRIKLRLTISGQDKSRLEDRMSEIIQPLKEIIGEHIIAWNEDKIEEILAEHLLKNKLTISTAESCTTGKLARMLTSLSGSSRYFKGGIIPYATQIKTELLHVDSKIIEENTVVSDKVAEEMAKSCKQIFHTDIAISTTGVAGPQRGEDGKDVGTVCFAIAMHKEVRVFQLYLPHLSRQDFIDFVAQKALEKTILWLEENKENSF